MTGEKQPTVALNSGVAMPQFGLGVFQTPPETTVHVVRQAVEAGYRAVDTAAAYRNEEGVGEALDGRDDVFVTTKLWNADHGFDETLREAVVHWGGGHLRPPDDAGEKLF